MEADRLALIGMAAAFIALVWGAWLRSPHRPLTLASAYALDPRAAPRSGTSRHGMTAQIHVFEPVEGGEVRVSLTYREPRAESRGQVGGAHGHVPRAVRRVGAERARRRSRLV